MKHEFIKWAKLNVNFLAIKEIYFQGSGDDFKVYIEMPSGFFTGTVANSFEEANMIVEELRKPDGYISLRKA